MASEQVDPPAPTSDAGEGDSLAPAFRHRLYSIYRPFWSWTGRTFYVRGPKGEHVAVVHHPFWRLRDELVVFQNEDRTKPLMRLRETRIVAANIRFDVIDATNDEMVGAVVARGIKSVARDAWDLVDAADKSIGNLREGGRPVLRRLFPLLRGRYHLEVDGVEAATIVQVEGMFSKEYSLEIWKDASVLDPRMALACAILAVTNEPASS